MKRNIVLRAARAGFDELAAAEIFLQVAAQRSFTTAGRVLGKSTSSLSRSVAELERQLGAQLLSRTTRRVSPTEAGQLYARHAERLLADQRAAHDAVAELTGGVPRGRLRVTLPVSIGERLLGPWLPELRRRHPELHLELDLSDRSVPLVSGGFDLAIRVGRQHDSSLRAQLLGKVPVLLVASRRYLARAGSPRRPRDLRDHACLTVSQLPGAVEWAFYHRRARTRSERVELEGAIHTTSAQLAAELAAADQGILRVNEWTVRELVARGELVEVMPAWSCTRLGDGGLPVYVVYAQLAGVDPPLKSRVFVALLREIIATGVLGGKRAAW
ncbi:MAG TPA: LysR substrate-binding domain-containing protein [Kofleriaceae bacterium]